MTLNQNEINIKISTQLTENESAAVEIMKMYRIVSDNLINYLKSKGLKNPHPAKEFVMDLVDRAIRLKDNSVNLPYNYYWSYINNNPHPVIYYKYEVPTEPYCCSDNIITDNLTTSIAYTAANIAGETKTEHIGPVFPEDI